MEWSGRIADSSISETAPEGERWVSPPALQDQAVQQMREKQWDAAVRTYAQLCAANPYSASHWFNYGYALHQSRRWAEAIEAWKKAIDLGFGFDNKLWPQGVFTEEWWRYLGPRINAPWYMIARAQCRLGRRVEALRCLERALAGGFNDQIALGKEPDLAPLRDGPRYQARFRALVGIPPEGLSRDERWRFDLDYLARRVEQIHYAPFRHVSQRQFREAIRCLEGRVSGLQEYEVVLQIQRILARIGDGHTNIRWPSTGPQPMLNYPLEFYWYSDGLFVSRAAGSAAQAVGGRVISIGGHPVEAVLKAVRPLCCVDNEMGVKVASAHMAGNPYVLAALHLVQDMDHVQLVVRKGDERVAIDLSRRLKADGPWLSIDGDRPSLSLNVRDPLWFERWPGTRMIYCQCNGIADTKEESFAGFFHRLFETVETEKVDYLTIDLRNNGGGNSALNPSLIHAVLRSDRINRRGHLFVLIGRRTFSAAQNLVSDLERETAAVFVGEPTGSRPNFVGESTLFALPCSGLTVSCSSLYFQGGWVSCDYRTWIEPEIPAELSSEDARSGRDSAMEAILKEIATRPSASPTGKENNRE
jgi:tetratricopeptide (TPR) repeat protein